MKRCLLHALAPLLSFALSYGSSKAQITSELKSYPPHERKRAEMFIEKLLDYRPDSGWKNRVLKVIEDERSGKIAFPKIRKRSEREMQKANRYAAIKSIEYVRSHEDTLRLAYENYGVPAFYASALLYLESFHGKIDMEKFGYRAFNALYTHYIKGRLARWALKQAATMLEHPEIFGEDPLDVIGSWAGCIGPAQLSPEWLVRFRKEASERGYPFSREKYPPPLAASFVLYSMNGGRFELGGRKALLDAIERYNGSRFYAERAESIVGMMRKNYGEKFGRVPLWADIIPHAERMSIPLKSPKKEFALPHGIFLNECPEYLLWRTK